MKKVKIKKERIWQHKDTENQQGVVVYWMSRDQRVRDNWALLYAQELAIERRVPLYVVFCLVPAFLGATQRQYGFMLRGLREIQENLQEKNISFALMAGSPEHEIPKFLNEHKAGWLITDFDPLRVKRQWKEKIARAIKIPFYEIDAHNIVPCREASSKQEYGAYTLRPKINRLLPRFLEEFPHVKKHPYPSIPKPYRLNWENILAQLKVDQDVCEVDWLKPGEKEAQRVWRGFLKNKINNYGSRRNDPNQDGQSNLSPYLHFGQISAQRVVLEALKADINTQDRDAFLEELIIRRELSDNFCFYNNEYDQLSGMPQWAQATLKAHQSDKRAHLYDVAELEQAVTHDPLWNAAQKEMVQRGKMHGYMRMYWAKKILEWTKSPEEAWGMAIYLNDKYQLDGRDPNGYAGIAWSIGGKHDRAWGERAVFGKIRYMSYNGCKSKFDVHNYEKHFNQ